jgi:hypothetical protein
MTLAVVSNDQYIHDAYGILAINISVILCFRLRQARRDGNKNDTQGHDLNDIQLERIRGVNG